MYDVEWIYESKVICPKFWLKILSENWCCLVDVLIKIIKIRIQYSWLFGGIEMGWVIIDKEFNWIGIGNRMEKGNILT